MMRRFAQCDVFSSQPTKGNALAVVIDGNQLSDEKMQSFARWTNLAETTFITKADDPRADYKLRIFTPSYEMLFAGHPTLGSAAVWLDAGGQSISSGKIMQECGIGLVEISTDPLSFKAPPTSIEPMQEDMRTRILSQLRIDQSKVLNTVTLNNGPEWQVFELLTAQDVLNIDSSLVNWPDFLGIGLIGAYEEGNVLDFEVRMLAPSSGMMEDPITGSLNAALAQWLNSDGRLKHKFTISQGTMIDRIGRVYIEKRSDDHIGIGGDVNILIRGELEL